VAVRDAALVTSGRHSWHCT